MARVPLHALFATRRAPHAGARFLKPETGMWAAMEELRALLEADDVDAALNAFKEGPEPEKGALRTLHEALQKEGCDRKVLVPNLRRMIDDRRFTPVWRPSPAAAATEERAWEEAK